MYLKSKIYPGDDVINNTGFFYNRFKLWMTFYLVAHLGILFISNAIYWDDWILFQGQPEIVIDTFVQQAATLFYLEGYLHVSLLKMGPWIYKLATFLLMFMTGFFLEKIMKKHSFLGGI
jgi:hypothetical protein